MVRSPVPLVVIAICAAAAVAGLWLVIRTPAPETAPAVQSVEDRARAREFFGAARKYDMDNGQEMRPRW